MMGAAGGSAPEAVSAHPEAGQTQKAGLSARDAQGWPLQERGGVVYPSAVSPREALALDGLVLPSSEVEWRGSVLSFYLI